MSVIGSQFVVGAAACAIGLVFVATAAQSERVRAVERVEAGDPIDAVPIAETAQKRRDRLNARMNEMLRSGQGARLVQPVTPRRQSSAARTVTREARVDASVRAVAMSVSNVVDADDSYRSTIAPPPHVGGHIVRTAGRGYTPPRLDLTTPPRIPTHDVECLTQAVYYEARNENADGQAAVAEVVMNRSRSGAYPRSVCAVVYQRNSRTCQFTFTCDGAIGRYPVDMRKWARAERIAREVYEGRSVTLLPANSVNYHANYVRPSWGARLERVRQIGAHIFYGAARGQGLTPGAVAAVRTAEAPTRGLIFTRIEALDRAYQAMGDGQTPAEITSARAGEP